MQSIKALSMAPDLIDWLMNSCQPRLLHIFDHACNLINERGEVLSIVAPQIGNGPFNLVVESEIYFPDSLHLESQVFISPTQLTLGNLNIHTTDARVWDPCPNWEMLHAKRDEILAQVKQLPRWMPGANTDLVHHQISDSLNSDLSIALANADISFAQKITARLAGLGAGLTPSGDDFIMGAMYATLIIHPPEIANMLAREITNIAVPLTTSLSAAWLSSAGKGEAGILWHEFFDALSSGGRAGNSIHLRETMDKILAVGETSGADALAGFTGVFMSLKERADSAYGYVHKHPRSHF
ncbi:MAG: oxamate carbamoyltransferase subunit AllH family protein [Anaerolineales bacterium]